MYIANNCIDEVDASNVFLVGRCWPFHVEESLMFPGEWEPMIHHPTRTGILCNRASSIYIHNFMILYPKKKLGWCNVLTRFLIIDILIDFRGFHSSHVTNHSHSCILLVPHLLPPFRRIRDLVCLGYFRRSTHIESLCYVRIYISIYTYVDNM